METIVLKALEDLCRRALAKAGMRARDIDLAVDHLLENEISGKASHGLVRVAEILRTFEKQPVPEQDPAIEHDNGSIAVLNARRQIGVVAVRHAMDLAIKRAPGHGLAFIGVRDYIATSGSMAYYLRRITAAGLIGLMGCNSVALVAPPAGRKRMVGTNPVGIGIPGANGESLIADIATSAIAYGKIMVMKDKGESVPEGMLIDADGAPSTDPADAYNGAILPLADYKGFALGLMVELLAGPLIGAKALKPDLFDNDGCFILALDPRAFGNPDFFGDVAAALQALRAGPPQPGFERVALPGDRSTALLAENKKRGKIAVAAKTLSDLRQLAGA